MDPTATLSILEVEAHRYFFHLEVPTEMRIALSQELYPPSGLFGLTDINPDLRSAIDAEIETLRLQTADPTPLEQLGRLLFNHLLTSEIKHTLRKLPADLPLVITTNDTDLPWELLHDGQEYLALKRPLARRLLDAAPARQNPRPNQIERAFLFIANPEGDLNQADQEVSNLTELCDTVAESEPLNAKPLARDRATKRAVQQRLAGGEYDVIHYSGHAESGVLRLADGQLTAQEIRETLSGQPFIFLNACQSAKATDAAAPASESLPYAGGATHDLASAFILGGAAAFIGTLWRVFDVSSREFAEKFYSLVLDGLPVGEALRQSRIWIRQNHPDDPLWASFVLYGDPTLRLAGLERREVRPITVLMVHLTNTLQLFKSMPLEEAAEVSKQAFDLLRQVAHRYAGQIHGPLANLLSVYFGTAKVREDDAERAILAALEMAHRLRRFVQQQTPPLPLSLELQLGVSTGQVVGRRLNTPAGVEYQISGQVGEVAKRLAAYANPDQVLVDETTRELTQTVFAFEAVEPLTITGEADVVAAYQLLPDKEPPPPPPRSPLVGRAEQITQLKSWWREAVAGQGRLVSIVGAAGIGKTRLVQTFQHTLAEGEIQSLEAACKSYDQTVSNSLLAQVIQGLLKITRIDDDPTRRSKLLALLQSLGPQPKEELHENLALLGQVIGLHFEAPTVTSLDAEARQGRLAELVWAALDYQSAPQPLLLVLEDIHWVDEASLAVLKQVMRAIDQMRVLVLAVHRSDWDPAWGYHYDLIPLRELDKNAQQELLTNLLQVETAPKSLRAAILSPTRGNPLYIEEIVNSLQARQDLIRVNGAWVLTSEPVEVLPKTVEGVILARLEQLTEKNEAGRKVLETASVIGDRFERQLLARMLPNSLSEQLDQHLRKLSDQNFIYRTGGLSSQANYAFYHDLTRQTVYDHLLERVRRSMHERAARALRELPGIEEDQMLERIARHYYYSDDRVNAIHYCLRAARRSAAGWANQTALIWYNRALEKLQSFSEKPPSLVEQAQEVQPRQRRQWQAEALEGKAQAQSAMGHDDEAIADYRRALGLMVNVDLFSVSQQARLYRQIAMAYENKGEFEAAQEMIKKGFEVLAEAETLETGRLYVWTGLLHYRQGKPGDGLTFCEQGIAIIEKLKVEQRTESRRDLAQAYLLRGLIHDVTGRKAVARGDLERSIALYKEAEYIPGLERAYSNLGILYQDIGQWDEALWYYLESEKLSKRTGEIKRQAAAAINLGEIYRRQGRLDQAIEANQRAWRLGQKFGFAERLGLALMNIGATYLKKDELIKAEDYLDQALRTFQDINNKANLPEVRRYLAELRLRQGRVDEALDLVQAALTEAKQSDNPLELGHAYRILGQITRQSGQFDTAETHLQESLALFQQQNSPYDLGLTQLELILLYKTQAEVSPDGELFRKKAQDLCEQAIQTFETLGAMFELQLAQKICASL